MSQMEKNDENCYEKRNPFKVVLDLLQGGKKREPPILDPAGAADIDTNRKMDPDHIDNISADKFNAEGEAVIVSQKINKDCYEYAKEVISINSNHSETQQLVHFHTDDSENVQDEYGRIRIGDNYIDQCYLKPHQIGGIRFMFENVMAGLGCILAHEMGLGKSLQVICLCDVLLKFTQENQILCVVPVNTLENWRNEFKKWSPNFVNSKSNSKFELFVVSQKTREMKDRQKIVADWALNGGVLLIGYELFRIMLTNESSPESFAGANILICDEGHRLKNERSIIYNALDGLSTSKRIILTGYPLQNHIKEYYHMVNFVRPEYLRSFDEFTTLFMDPIQTAHFDDHNADEFNLMLERVHVLNMVLRPVVQRRSDILDRTLPPKLDFVIPVGLTSLQRRLLCKYYNESFLTQKNALMAFSNCTNICNHPDILFKGKTKECNAWIGSSMDDYKELEISASPKIEILLTIIGESLKAADRVIVFTQSLITLDLLEKFLYSEKSWQKDVHYFRMDGSVNGADRMLFVEKFNANDNVKVFLISTKAGCVGVNLVGANRLILMDVSWNPCHDNQAISRVYRYDQKKPTYIYRLVSEYSIERFVYTKQIRKQSMAHRLLDGRKPPHPELKDKLMEWLNESETSVEGYEKRYDDNILNKLVEKHKNVIVKNPFSHDEILRSIERNDAGMDEKIALDNYVRQVSKYVNAYQLSTKKVAEPFQALHVMDGNVGVNAKAPVTDENKVHSWIGVSKWKSDGFNAEIIISPEDCSIASNRKTVHIQKGQEIVVIRHLGKTYIETADGVISVKDSELETIPKLKDIIVKV